MVVRGGGSWSDHRVGGIGVVASAVRGLEGTEQTQDTSNHQCDDDDSQ